MEKKVIIVCYSFPPNPGIGGRRWAKFAKYLALQNIVISVLKSPLDSPDKSPWSKDVVNLENIISVETNYPKIIHTKISSFTDKLRYRFELFKLKSKNPANLFDKSSNWGETLIPEIEKLIFQGYDTIICTAAPFQYLASVSDLKRKHPHVKFIADFRDPWVNNTIAYGFNSLPTNRLEAEKELQRKVFENFDHLLCVDKTHESYISKEISDSNKVTCLPNGFDPEDFAGLEASKKLTNEDKISLVFTGSVYYQSLSVFKAFYNAIKKSKEIQAFFIFDFYGSIPKEFEQFFKDADLKGVLNFHGKISLDEVGIKISQADAAMLFLTDDLNYTKSTKFYEYIHLKRKIAVFSKYGEVNKYVEDNGIGYSIEPNSIGEALMRIKKDYLEKNLAIPTDYVFSDYSIPNISKSLLSIIKQ